MSRAKNTTHLFLVPKLYLGTRLPWKLCFRKGPGIVALAVRERRQTLFEKPFGWEIFRVFGLRGQSVGAGERVPRVLRVAQGSSILLLVNFWTESSCGC